MINRMVEPDIGSGPDRRCGHSDQEQGRSCGGASVTCCRPPGCCRTAGWWTTSRRFRSCRGVPKAEAREAGSGADGQGRPGPGARAALPAAAVRWPAAARRRGPSPGQRPEHPVDGRAVRRGRPDRARRPPGGAEPAAARAGQDDRLRHPRHRRGLHAGRPGRHPPQGRSDRAGRAPRRRSWPTRPTISSPASSAPTRASGDLFLQQRENDGGLTLVVDRDGRPVGVLDARTRTRRATARPA